MKKNIFSKILTGFLLISLLLSPIAPVFAQTSNNDLLKKTPLEEVIDIPKVIISKDIISDLSLVDWTQKIEVKGKEVELSSKESLEVLDLPSEIKNFVEMYRGDIDAINGTIFMLPSTKADKKKHITEALQYSIAKNLIEKGQLPANYFELKIKGLVQSTDHIINIEKDSGKQLNAEDAVPIDATPKAVITNVRNIDAQTKKKESETSIIGSAWKAVTGAVSDVTGFIGDQLSHVQDVSESIIANVSSATSPKGEFIKNEHDAKAWRKYLDERVEYLKTQNNLPAYVLEKAVEGQNKFENYLIQKEYITEPGGEVRSPGISFGGVFKNTMRWLFALVLPEKAYAYIFGSEDFETCSSLPCSFEDNGAWGSVTPSLDHGSIVSGVDSLKEIVTGEGGGSLGMDGFSTNDIRVQFKVWIPNPTTWGVSGYFSVLILQDSSNANTVWFNVEDWGTPRLTVAGDVLSYTNTGIDLVPGAVNTIEARIKIGSSTGDVDIWLNNTTEGSPNYNGSGTMNTGTDNIDAVLAGLVYAPENGISTTYFDDIIVNNAFIGAGITNTSPSAPTNILTEGQTNPTNVNDSTPEFSAIYVDSDTGDLANKYRLQVSTSTTFSTIKWDSGTTTMATTTAGYRSPDIIYGGSSLATSTTYYSRILFIDDGNAAGAWSTATSTFILGTVEGNSTSTQAALQYLINNQNDDGSWGSATTTFTTTVAVVDALDAYGETGTSYQNGIDWLEDYIVDNNDYLAQQTELLARAGQGTTTSTTLANALDKSTGGFVFDRSYQSDPATTAKALQALIEAEYEDPGANPDLTVLLGLYYLTQTQRFDEGWSAFNGGVSSIPITSEVVEALLPYKGQTLTGFESSSIAINDTLNPALASLKATQLSNGTWDNNLLNTAIAFYTLKKSKTAATYAYETVSYLEGAQAGNGSFGGGNLYTTALVLRALVIPEATLGNLVIEDIVPLTSLQNASSSSIRIDITNNGDAVVDTGILNIVADHYLIGSFNFASSSISIDPEETAQITINIANTVGYVGNVVFDAFVEGIGNTAYPDSRYQETLAFTEEPSDLPGLPIYFIAEKHVNSGPAIAINVQWGQKSDPNRLNYRVMARHMGSTTWEYSDVSNSLSGGFITGSLFTEDQLYEVTVGALAQDGVRVVYYTSPVQVKTSINENEYVAGTVSGTMRDVNGLVPNLAFIAGGNNASSDEDGNISVSNIPYGRGWIRPDSFRYEKYITTYTTADTAVTNHKAYTNLIPDTEDPEITYFVIANEGDYEMENLQTKTIHLGVDDDIGITGTGVVESATFSYYDPNDTEWHVIGTMQGPLSSTVAYSWNVGGDLVGDGYKIKATIRDYSGKESDPVEWGPFEFTTGNASPEFSFITPLPATTTPIDLSHTIEWTDRDDDNNASILLSYDPDQISGNANHTNIVTVYEDSALNQYVWNTSSVATGTYYIMALISDGVNSNQVIYSDEPVIISHNAPTAPSSLLAEGQTNPTSVTDNTPELSAIYNDPNDGNNATHYRIQLSATSTFSSMQWDSNKTALASSTAKGSRIADVSYSGSSLASSTSYYWRIKFWDNSNNEGAWSTTTSSFILATSTGGGGGVSTSTPAFITSIAAGGTPSSVTTAGVNTTGANFIIITAAYNTGSTPTISDNKSNTWTPLTDSVVVGSVTTRLYYSQNPTVGSGHTFSNTASSNYSSVCVAAFSGVATSSMDVQNGATNSSTTIQPGSVTPSVDKELLVTGLGWNVGRTTYPPTINSSFTVATSSNFLSGNHYGCSIGYYIQATSSAANPTWSLGSSQSNAARISTFKPATTTTP
ncbi:MAG: hypothetical protein WAX44_03280 [Minisyncoccia bacterium]